LFFYFQYKIKIIYVDTPSLITGFYLSMIEIQGEAMAWDYLLANSGDIIEGE